MNDSAQECSGLAMDAPAQNRPSRFMDFAVTWAPLVLVSSAIFWFSSRPGLGKPNLVEALFSSWFGSYLWYNSIQGGVTALNAASSWLAHLAEYALLFAAGLWGVERQWPDLVRPWLPAFGYAALFAVSDEFHQHFVPGRHSDLRDVATDWAGAALVAAFVWLGRANRAKNRSMQRAAERRAYHS